MAAALNLSSAKVTSIPTLFSWSQTYAAGTVFALLSLKKPEEENGTSEVLAFVGKEILEDFENEYFPITEKNLDTITKALEKVMEKIPKEVSFGAAVASFVDDTLYVFACGHVQIQVHRNGVLATILSSDLNSMQVVNASGFVENNDVVILKTFAFSQIVSDEKLNEALSDKTIEQSAQILLPLVEEKQEPQATALFIGCYPKAKVVVPATEIASEDKPEEEQNEEKSQEEPLQEKTVAEPNEPDESDISLESLQPSEESETLSSPPIQAPANEFLHTFDDMETSRPMTNTPTLFSSLIPLLSKIPLPKLSLGNSKKRALFVIVALLIVGTIAIITTLKNKEDKKTHDLFLSVYPKAQKKYEEGQALIDLNKNLARDDFAESEKILKENQDKFPKDSNEEKQITDLLSKVEAQLATASSANKVSVTEEGSGKSALLDQAKSKKDVLSVAQDDTKVYIANTSGILSIDKKSKAETTLLKKDWNTISGFGVYISNVYVLDRGSSQIYKFVASDSNFTKQDYLSGKVDLSKSISMAIDGSIWVLTVDGSVFKFTKGVADSYSLSGLDKPFVNPTRITTSADSDSYYVLDNGNNRIVQISKDKGYVAQYQSDLLKSAKEFEVVEKDKKVYFLSNSKIYSFPL